MGTRYYIQERSASFKRHVLQVAHPDEFLHLRGDIEEFDPAVFSRAIGTKFR